MALLLVLLVTAMLIALIFEFAYGTRVSLRAAANYRDSRRAYYLARSGVYVFARFKELQDYIPQGEWGVVPMVSESDTGLRIQWEDEGGKIRIKDIKTENSVARAMFEWLFEQQGISLEVRDRMTERESTVNQITLLSELHAYMSDEDYDKVHEFLTVESPGNKININTASPLVLESMGFNPGAISLILEERAKTPFTEESIRTYPAIDNVMIRDLQTAAENYLSASSNVLTVRSAATVGGYTKEIEAIISRPSDVRYWRTL